MILGKCEVIPDPLDPFVITVSHSGFGGSLSLSSPFELWYYLLVNVMATTLVQVLAWDLGSWPGLLAGSIQTPEIMKYHSTF